MLFRLFNCCQCCVVSVCNSSLSVVQVTPGAFMGRKSTLSTPSLVGRKMNMHSPSARLSAGSLRSPACRSSSCVKSALCFSSPRGCGPVAVVKLSVAVVIRCTSVSLPIPMESVSVQPWARREPCPLSQLGAPFSACFLNVSILKCWILSNACSVPSQMIAWVFFLCPVSVGVPVFHNLWWFSFSPSWCCGSHLRLVETVFAFRPLPSQQHAVRCTGVVLGAARSCGSQPAPRTLSVTLGVQWAGC